MLAPQSRHFSLTFNAPISGIALVGCTGPLIETWNRRYNHGAAVHIESKHCDGLLLTGENAYMHGNLWQLDLAMTGPMVSDALVADICAQLLAAVVPPNNGVQA